MFVQPVRVLGFLLLPADESIQSFLTHWYALRRDRRWPSFACFDPVELPSLLPHLLVFEVVGGSPDFVCRLAGEHVRVMYGGPLRGMSISGLLAGNPTVGVIGSGLRECLMLGGPVGLDASIESADGVPRRVRLAIVPFGRDDDAVSRLVCCVFFVPST